MGNGVWQRESARKKIPGILARALFLSEEAGAVFDTFWTNKKSSCFPDTSAGNCQTGAASVKKARREVRFGFDP